MWNHDGNSLEEEASSQIRKDWKLFYVQRSRILTDLSDSCCSVSSSSASTLNSRLSDLRVQPMDGSATENVLTIRRGAPFATTRKNAQRCPTGGVSSVLKLNCVRISEPRSQASKTTTELNWREPRRGGQVSELTMRKLTSSSKKILKCYLYTLQLQSK